MRTLVIYCTHNASPNLDFFLNNGGYLKDTDIDYYICFNGDVDISKYQPFTKNTNLFLVTRENVGADFGAWSHVLLTDNLYQKYDYFILLNNTCAGPFLPIYTKDSWIKIFIDQLSNEIKLVGPTINHFYGKSHVQSYFLCTDKIGIKIGIENNIFNNDFVSKFRNREWASYKWEFILTYEVGFSQAILNNGYNIKCMLKGLENIDFRQVRDKNKLDFSYGSVEADMCWDNHYFGMTFHPYEVIFYKSNRNLPLVNKYKDFHDKNIQIKARYGSGDKCVDVTDIISKMFICDNLVIIPQNTDFNSIFTDPCFGKVKILTISINNKIYQLEENNQRSHFEMRLQ